MAILQRERASRTNHMVNHLSYTLVAINIECGGLWWSPTASEALSDGLNFKIFWGSMPPPPPREPCALYVHKKLCAVCTNPHSIYVCPPPFLQCLDPSLHNIWLEYLCAMGDWAYFQIPRGMTTSLFEPKSLHW